MSRKPSRKDRRRKLVILLAILLVSTTIATALFVPWSRTGWSDFRGFAYLPSDMLSAFKEAPEPWGTRGHDPLDEQARRLLADHVGTDENGKDQPIVIADVAKSTIDDGSIPFAWRRPLPSQNYGPGNRPPAQDDWHPSFRGPWGAPGGYGGGGGGGQTSSSGGGGGGGGGGSPDNPGGTPPVDCSLPANAENPACKQTTENPNPGNENNGDDNSSNVDCNLPANAQNTACQNAGNENPGGGGDDEEIADGGNPGDDMPPIDDGDYDGGDDPQNPPGSNPSTSVDEPASLALLLFASAGLLALRRNRRKPTA